MRLRHSKQDTDEAKKFANLIKQNFAIRRNCFQFSRHLSAKNKRILKVIERNTE